MFHSLTSWVSCSIEEAKEATSSLKPAALIGIRINNGHRPKSHELSRDQQLCRICLRRKTLMEMLQGIIL
ncbi:unnamed protein product [Victoria cruziana]